MSQPASSAANRGGFSIPPIAIIGALFFIFGFATWINATLIPYFKITLGLNDAQSFLVASAFYLSYFVMAFPAAGILKKTGLKNGMMFGLFVMAAGALLFLPAASMRAYWLFLVGLFTIATGLTILQTASNPYVVALGPIESAAQRISIMGICNKVAGAIAPLLLIRAITKNSDEIDQIKALLPTLDSAGRDSLLAELSGRLSTPYLTMALVLVGLGLLIRFSGLPEIEESEDSDLKKTGPSANSIFGIPHLVLGAIAIFFAVAVEVLAVDSSIRYAEHVGYAFADAKFFPTITLGLMIVAYLCGTIFIPKYIPQRRALLWISVLGLLLSIVIVSISGHFSVWALASLGLANALLWPAIWPLALDGLGRWTKSGSALLIMGIIGGAILPPVYGMISDRSNPQTAYLLLIPCYLYLIFYAVSGWKMGRDQ